MYMAVTGLKIFRNITLKVKTVRRKDVFLFFPQLEPKDQPCPCMGTPPNHTILGENHVNNICEEGTRLDPPPIFFSLSKREKWCAIQSASSQTLHNHAWKCSLISTQSNWTFLLWKLTDSWHNSQTIRWRLPTVISNYMCWYRDLKNMYI